VGAGLPPVQVRDMVAGPIVAFVHPLQTDVEYLYRVQIPGTDSAGMARPSLDRPA